MKYKSYQAGGAIYTPFIPNRATAQQTTAPATDSATKAEKITGTMKEKIINVLKENGIPSDVEAFLSTANQFLTKSTSLSNMSLFGGTDDDYDLSDLIRIQKMANDVKWNKGLWDNAVKNLDSENAWGEVALDSRGYMYVLNEDGKIETVSADEYYKGLEGGKYRAITNEQLMSLRERQGGMALQSGVLSNMNKAIGINTIHDQLREVVEKLGTSTLQGYSSKEANDIFNGAKLLMSSGPDGYYKITDEKQGRDVNKALEYLYRQLSPEMRRTLDANVAANGGNPNSMDKLDMIEMILLGHTDQKRAADFDAGATKSAGLDVESKKTTSEKTKEQSLAERYASGNGFGNPEWTPIMTSNQNVPMYVSAQNLGPILTKDMKQQFGDGNVENVLNNAYGIGAIVDRRSITFGDIPVEWDDVSKLMYEGDTNIHRIYLPATTDSEGKIRPDFALQQKIDTLNSQLEGMTAGQIKSAISDIPGVVYNENTGMVEAQNTRPFITFGAVASSDTMGKSLKTSQYLHELTNEEDRMKKDKYNQIVSQRPAYIGSGAEKTNNPKTTWWWGYKFYEGNVFIPINDSIIAASIYNNQLVPQETYMNMSAKAQAKAEYNQRQAVADQLRQSGQLKTSF